MNFARPLTNSKSIRGGASRLALASLAMMVSAPAALAQTAPAAPASAAAVPAASPLAQIPGAVIEYYDVGGFTIDQLRASIEAVRPKDPKTRQVMVTSVEWSIGTSIKKETLGTACKVVAATASMKSKVALPRLASTTGVPEKTLVQWQKYVASLETQQAALLRQIHDRLPEVERAVAGTSCEQAGAAANQAIQEISKQPTAAAAVAPPKG